MTLDERVEGGVRTEAKAPRHLLGANIWALGLGSWVFGSTVACNVTPAESDHRSISAPGDVPPKRR